MAQYHLSTGMRAQHADNVHYATSFHQSKPASKPLLGRAGTPQGLGGGGGAMPHVKRTQHLTKRRCTSVLHQSTIMVAEWPYAQRVHA